MIGAILIVILLLTIYNVIFYIPNKLKSQDEKISLHFKELYIRLNRLEKMIKDNLNEEER